MPIRIGTQLGSHEITGLLGKGGMGEVFRARDAKLKREVAIKILPDEFSQDSDRVGRFQREAEVLASLNHPNIAGIYDVQDAMGTRFLVLELVEGETLADRIARGPIPVDEALGIGVQICEALEAAHEKGIIHRDLKPANVKVTPEGKVKVLDFGLAKAMESTTANLASSNSPTLVAGPVGSIIVGTAAYMSPEQARGRTADQRSDIFGFGCVLYEMLTGHQAFHGEDVSDILASVMKVDPDFSHLPQQLDPKVTDLLRRCLAKNRKERWYAVGDLRVELNSILNEPQRSKTTPMAKTPFWKQAVLPLIAALLAAAAAITAMWITRPAALPRRVVRYSFTLPKDQDFTRTGRQVVTISHDGTKIVYVANLQLYLKSIGEMEAKPIPGSKQDVNTPMFSPNDEWVAFYVPAERKLKKIPLAGGPSVTLAEMLDNPLGASWAVNDQIVVGQSSKGIVRIPAGGGKPEILIPLKTGELYDGPQLLPGGEELLFTIARIGANPEVRWNAAQVVVQNIHSEARKVVIQAGSEARYVSTGHIIYTVGPTAFAAPFDLKSLQTTGGPVPVLDGLRRSAQAQTAAAFYSVADDGTLVWIPGVIEDLPRILALVDRSGTMKVLPLPPAGYDTPRISPDGKHLAVGIGDSKEFNVWIYDFDANTSIRRLTFGGKNQSPAWTPDGKRIAFRSDRDGEGLFWQAADGSGVAERLSTVEKDSLYHAPIDWTPDGKTLTFFSSRANTAGGSVWTLSLDGDRKPKPFLTSTTNNMRRTSFSPDGQWIAYASNEEDGNFSVYVQPFPPTGAKYKISAKNGADSPLWIPDGKQIIFQSGRLLMSVDVQTRPSFTFSEPKALPIEIENTQGRPYDITRDGKQFLVMQQSTDTTAGAKATPQINIVLNWLTELQQRVPVH